MSVPTRPEVEIAYHCLSDYAIFVVVITVPADELGKPSLLQSLSEHCEGCQVVFLVGLLRGLGSKVHVYDLLYIFRNDNQ